MLTDAYGRNCNASDQQSRMCNTPVCCAIAQFVLSCDEHLINFRSQEHINSTHKWHISSFPTESGNLDPSTLVTGVSIRPSFMIGHSRRCDKGSLQFLGISREHAIDAFPCWLEDFISCWPSQPTAPVTATILMRGEACIMACSILIVCKYYTISTAATHLSFCLVRRHHHPVL